SVSDCAPLSASFVLCHPLSRSLTLHTSCFFLFFFIDTPPPEIYPLSLHDALPIFRCRSSPREKAAHLSRQDLRQRRQASPRPARARRPASPDHGRRPRNRRRERRRNKLARRPPLGSTAPIPPRPSPASHGKARGEHLRLRCRSRNSPIASCWPGDGGAPPLR